MSIGNYQGYPYPPCPPPCPPKRPGTIVDPTLTLAGEAADAKVTGEYIRQSQTDIEWAKNSISILESNVSQMSISIDEIQQEIEDIKSYGGEIEGLKNRVNALEDSQQEFIRFMSTIQTSLLEIDERFDEDENRLLQDEQQISQNKSDIAVLFERIVKVNSDIEDIESKIELIEASLVTKQDKLTAGDNIKIEGNVISAMVGSTVLTNDLTSDYDVGGIVQGTSFLAGTPIEDVIKSMLQKDTPTIPFKLYYGVFDSIPDDVSEMDSVNVTRKQLLSNYVWKNVTANYQYPCLAIDKSLGLSLYKIDQSGFGLGFNVKDLGDQLLYYWEPPMTDTNVRLIYFFEEGY